MRHIRKYFLRLQLFFAVFAALSLFFSAGAFAQVSLPKDDSSSESFEGGDASAALPDMKNYIFETRMANFDSKNYRNAVAALFKAYEKSADFSIKKGSKGKVGIKIYTNSGAGISTPKDLLDAVIIELEKRGYSKSDITIVDMVRRKIRAAGFLPKLSEIQNGAPDDYNGVKVADIESGKYFDARWFYDNPLQPKSMFKNPEAEKDVYNPERRKSYLPVPLFLSVDFWINLPVVTDMDGLGVCAALGNASIWNMSNNERFLKSPSNASVAAAEVCAIPEMKKSMLFNILSLERGQFVGGSVFNARFTFSEHTLILSSDSVAVDYIAWELINKHRRMHGFEIIEDMPSLLDMSKQLEIGDWDLRKHNRVLVPYSSR